MRFVALISLLWMAGCPSMTQSPDALCRAHTDCNTGQLCVVAEGAGFGVCVAACGNGVVDDGEECDDGNADEADGCTSACVACGNGVKHANEACDDGNRIDTDSCTNACVVAGCGDGVLRTDIQDPNVANYEACDDGNGIATDACTNSCALARCGDGLARTDITDRNDQAFEECDDTQEGHESNNDACTDFCRHAFCGDGIQHGGVEECDDANDVDNDACSNECAMAYCGDGVVRIDLLENDPTHEECDDANHDNSDACVGGCDVASCGDGYLRIGPEPGAEGYEACDDGNLEDLDGCSSTCEQEQVDTFENVDGMNAVVACEQGACRICRPETTDCLDVILFNGGTFTLSAEAEGEFLHDPHLVFVSRFWMAKTETTRGAWAACQGHDDCGAAETSGGSEKPVGVSWQAAMDFCETFGGRLPTEAEWEFAARGGGQQRTYPWGDANPTCARANARAVCGSGGSVQPAAVCSENRITTEGLCDMAGNVAEWTLDRFDTDFSDIPRWTQDQLTGDPLRNPIYRSGTMDNAVVRGGYCMSRNVSELRVIDRQPIQVNQARLIDGFRCVFSPIGLDDMRNR